MKCPPLGTGGEHITWPDQVPPRGQKASSTRNLKPQTSNLKPQTETKLPKYTGSDLYVDAGCCFRFLMYIQEIKKGQPTKPHMCSVCYI